MNTLSGYLDCLAAIWSLEDKRIEEFNDLLVFIFFTPGFTKLGQVLPQTVTPRGKMYIAFTDKLVGQRLVGSRRRRYPSSNYSEENPVAATERRGKD